MKTPEQLEAQRITRWVRTMPVVFLILGLSFGSWLSRLPSVRDALGATTLEMSFYGICLAGGSIVGLVLSGRIVQIFGPKRTLLITTVAQAAALVAAVWILLGISIPLGLALLFIYGFMFAAGDVAMNVSGAEAERAFGKPRMPLMHAGYSTGTVTAMGLGALAETFNVSVLAHISGIAVLLIVVVLLSLRNLPNDETVEHGAPVTESTGAIPIVAASGTHQPAFSTATGPIAIISPTTETATTPATPPVGPRRPYSPWRNPHVLLIGCIALCAGLIDGTASDWLPLALVDGRGLENASGTLMLGIFFASIMVVRVAGSAVLTRFGRVPTLYASAALSTLGVIMVLTLPGTPLLIVGVVLWGLGSGLGWPIAISAAADNPKTAVRDVAAVSAVGYGSMLLGPMAFGIMGEWFGLLNTFWVLLLFTLALGLLATNAREPGLRDRATGRLSR